MKKTHQVCIALAFMGIAGLASAATLVSNLDQPVSGGYDCYYSQVFASPFETDSEAWHLVSVTLRLTPVEMPSDGSVVWIFADDGSGRPGNRLAGLLNPTLPIGVEGDYTFTASAPMQLASDTRYHVALGSDQYNSNMQRNHWYTTTSTAFTGPGDKPFQAYLDVSHNFVWIYYRDYYTMMFEVEVVLSAVATEQTTWGAIKCLFAK